MANSFDKLVNEICNLVTENELSRKSKTGKKRRKRTKREQKLFNNTIKFILAKLWKDLNTVPVKETSFNLYQHYYSNNKRYTNHLGLAYRTFKAVYDTLCKLNYITMTAEKRYNPEKPEDARSRMHIPDGYLRERLLGLSEKFSYTIGISMDSNKSLIWIPIILLTVAMLPLPYGYYMILRLVIPIFSVIMAINAYKISSDSLYTFIFIGMAILYNPFLPISLFKEMWVVLNLISAGVFFMYRRATN